MVSIRMVTTKVSPGVLSAILYIFLDLFSTALLDITLTRVVCLRYYKRIDRGERIDVKSADIHGVSNYLVGSRSYFINIVALCIKLSFLVVIFFANISIDSEDSNYTKTHRYGTYQLQPSDKYIQEHKGEEESAVNKISENIKSCYIQEGNNITYYALRFNLSNSEQMEQRRTNINYYSHNSECIANRTLDVNESTVFCMSPKIVRNEDMLIHVRGCTRIDGKNQTLCLSSLAEPELKTAPLIQSFESSIGTNSNSNSDGRNDDGNRDNNRLIVFNGTEVRQTFSEYINPLLTCLSIPIAVRNENERDFFNHCLLIEYNGVQNTTTVEQWTFRGGQFIMMYPGIIFESIVPFGKEASIRYLQQPFPFTDYKTMSGQLVSQASEYTCFDRENDQEVRIINPDTVATIPLYTVVVVIACGAFIVVCFIVTCVIVSVDNRPRFNTVNGMSSIIREEYMPSGRSYMAGEKVLLAMNHISDDEIRFGPIAVSHL